MALLEREFASLIEQINATADAAERAALIERKRRLDELLAALG